MGAKKAEEAPVERFTKEQLVIAKRYRAKQDVVSVVLKDHVSYSFEEADEAIDEFLKGKVR